MSQATAPTLRFYSNPMSRARTVRWMLEECGAEYETVELEYGQAMKTPQYLAINPMGKVPALQHGDAVITETGAILAYLAELFPAKHLAPPQGSPERAAYLRWLFFVAGPVDAAIHARIEGWLENQTDRQATAAGFGRFDDVVRTLQQAVAGKRYVCGEHFTAADLYLASYIGWGMMQGSLPALAEFKAYAQPLLQRAASVRADALDGPMAVAA
ncbi:glutathione S-transferase family protein [Comamonas guangdongensis]|uniref:Glutathione S-transferase family protein n=1 Tax=Comamonas guangdongensis TaxID=510515 RepID=A0ABV3ZWX0_9BURK